jgi:putative oxidoreductase
VKIAVVIARILLGMLFVVFGSDFFLHFLPEVEASKSGVAFLEALFATGYMFYVIKIIEIGAGVFLLAGFRVPLALALLAPIIFNIALYHFFLDLNGIAIAIVSVIVALELFLLWSHRQAFMGLLELNATSSSDSLLGEARQEGRYGK